MSRGVPSLLALALLVGACATHPAPAPATSTSTPAAPAAQGRSDTMVTGRDSGLGLQGPVTPPELKTVVLAPYAPPVPADCAGLAAAITALDDLLGPDVDAPPAAAQSLDSKAGQAMGSAVRGAIPYRWVVRWMTGAGKADRELRQAILAGTARRGFLKGLRQAGRCG